MKILLSAYACHPNKGSEPGVGWNWLREISKYHEVWVFIYAEQGQRDAVLEEIQKLPQQSNIHIVPISVSTYFQTHLYRVRYEIWQWRAYKIAQNIVNTNEIDLIHHLTLATWWNCGHLWKLEKPFIFGPISGAQRIPFQGYRFLRRVDKIKELLRSILFNLSWQFWRRPRMAMKKARLVFVGNSATLNLIKKFRDNDNTIQLSEVGVLELPEMTKKAFRENYIKLFWSGLLLPRKNFGFLLVVLSHLPSNLNWSLNVAGDGNLLPYWQKKTKLLGLDKKINFLGKIDYSKMKYEYAYSDIFVFPSLREGTPTVLLEALSHGLPVIAFSLHGAKHLLNKDCAIIVDVKNTEQMIQDFTSAILRLAKNPELRQQMGTAGRKRIEEHFLWEKRGEVMNEYYQNLIKNE